MKVEFFGKPINLKNEIKLKESETKLLVQNAVSEKDKEIIEKTKEMIEMVAREVEEGKVYRNGVLLEERYLPEGTVTYSKIFYDIIVPENTVFALGDNRSGSGDCRHFGCIPFEKIEGIVEFRFWPFNKWGAVE